MKKMRVVELYPVQTAHVDEFCDHQIIGEKVHVIGYETRRDPEGGEDFGCVEVRLVMTPKTFFAVCRRGVEMEKSGQLPTETAFLVSNHHH